MKRLLLVGLFLTTKLFSQEFETTFENSNFTLFVPLNSLGKHELVNYNRFRLTEHIRIDNWFLTAIGDIENTLNINYINSYRTANIMIRSDTPFSTQTSTYNYKEGEIYSQLYRLYAGYADEKHRVSFGLQRVSMGVGRIWNPTDLFNPKNPLALEPDEVYGSFSLVYTYSLSDLSEMTIIAAQRADNSFKYLGRVKNYLDVLDVSFNIVNMNDVAMVGYELEGELFNTGIELRSEGGWFDDKIHKKRFFQGLMGADFSFENSLTFVGEWLHTSKTFKTDLKVTTPLGTANNLVLSNDYLGMNVGYEFDALLYGSLITIVSADDGSFYLSPTLSYSLADDTTMRLGTMLNYGKRDSEFGNYGKTYYLNVNLTF